MTIADRGGQEAVDSLDMEGYFGLCTPVEVNIIKKIEKVLSSYIELKLWFPPKTIDWNCVTKLLSCY